METLFREMDYGIDVGSWRPSFQELARCLMAIGCCEDEKYAGGRGRLMVSDFVLDIMEEPRTRADLINNWPAIWKPIAEQWNLPA